MNFLKFDHIGLSVADLDSQVAWYTMALNLRATNSFEVEQLNLRGCFLVDDQGLVIELLERKGSEPGLQAESPAAALLTRGYGHIALRVDDTQNAFDNLIIAGATAISAPQPAPEQGVSFAFVADPEGNLIEILDRKEPVK
ncbi:MAG: hypothetical protein RIR16_437 [Actinomycetota bacterium]